MAGLVVKSWLRTDCRRFHIEANPSFASLHAKIKEIYGLPDSDFLVKYKDSDGDLVTITNDTELYEMFQTLSSELLSPLRLEVILSSRLEPGGAGGPAPDEPSFLAENPPSYYRTKFSPEFSDQDILDVLRDISMYISARDPGARFQSWVSSEKSLITPSVMTKIAATLPVRDGKLVSKPRHEADLLASGDVLLWTKDEVGQWLKNVDFPEFVSTFQEHDVTGDVLVELTNESLKDMGIISTGKRIKILRLIERLRERRAKPRSTRHKSLSERSTPFSTPKGLKT